MRKTNIFAAVLGLVAVPAIAGDYDGSNPMICAATKLMECIDGETCKEVRAEDINAPEFIRLENLKDMKIRTNRRGDDNAAPIRNKESLEGNLILQGVGVENPVGWSMSVNEDTGRMVLTASGTEVGFVIFGACTLL